MRGQPDQAHDLGIGKKVEPETSEAPEWRKVPGKQYHYVNSKGQKAYCPPVPDTPMHPSPWDLWREHMRKHGIEPVDFGCFYPLG